MDLFPTLLEEYDLTGAPGVDEFINHVKTNGQSHEHSLAVGGVSSHGGWEINICIPSSRIVYHTSTYSFITTSIRATSHIKISLALS